MHIYYVAIQQTEFWKLLKNIFKSQNLVIKNHQILLSSDSITVLIFIHS